MYSNSLDVSSYFPLNYSDIFSFACEIAFTDSETAETDDETTDTDVETAEIEAFIFLEVEVSCCLFYKVAACKAFLMSLTKPCHSSVS